MFALENKRHPHPLCPYQPIKSKPTLDGLSVINAWVFINQSLLHCLENKWHPHPLCPYQPIKSKPKVEGLSVINAWVFCSQVQINVIG